MVWCVSMILTRTIKQRYLKYGILLRNIAWKSGLPLRCADFPNFGHQTFGFSFDSVSNDYKIMFVEIKQRQPLAGYIYSQKGGCWSKINPSNFPDHGVIYCSRLVFNGSPFWLVWRNLNEVKYTCPTIISFDVRGEKLRLLPDLVQSIRIVIQVIIC